MQKIIPFLWFDDNAEDAMNFYTSIFKNSRIEKISRYKDAGPNGNEEVLVGAFRLEGREFMALNGGPDFTKFSPAVSFFVSCDNEEEIDEYWRKLSEGGVVFMELSKYPFSEKFGWVQDKFGVSWQLNLAKCAQKITSFLLFTGPEHGKAEEAVDFYKSLFNNSDIGYIQHYGKGEPGAEGTVKHAAFSLDGVDFMTMDSNGPHDFGFTAAISFYVNCETQEEVDGFWEKLSEGGEKSMCGWLKDKYGIWWQIVPTILEDLLGDQDTVKAKRVMEAMLKMKKINMEELKDAYDQQ